MESKVNYIVVGIFVVLLSIVLIGIVLWLGTGGPRPGQNHYVVYMDESVAGLSVDSPVKFLGVDVGRVTDIGINPRNVEQVKITLQVREGTPITTDTRAQLEAQGLTGIAFINLTGGSRKASLLDPKPTPPYPEIESAPSLFTRFDETTSRLLDNLIETSDRLNELLNEQNRDAIGETLVAAETLVKDLAQRSQQLEQVLNRFAHAAETTTQAGERLNQLLLQLDGSVEAFNAMALGVADASGAVEQSLAVTENSITRFSQQTLPELNQTIVEIGAAARSLRQLTQQLERDPSILIYGTPQTEPGPGE